MNADCPDHRREEDEEDGTEVARMPDEEEVIRRAPEAPVRRDRFVGEIEPVRFRPCPEPLV